MDRLAQHCRVTCWAEDRAIPRDELLTKAEGSHGIITLLTERVDAELLEHAGSELRIVANYAVGVDNIDVVACTERSVMVSNTPDVLTEATADMAWALLMAAARRVAEGDRLVRSQQPWLFGPETMLGRDVYGRTLGIVGLGRIGKAVGRRAGGHGMRVVFHSRSHVPDTSVALAGGGSPRADSMSLDGLLEVADFVSVHVNLDASTHHLIGRRELSLMKPTAVLVNTSRGPVLDEEALADALAAGTIFAAGLDVFEHEPEISARLLAQPRAVLCPHLGSATFDTRLAMGMLAADNVLAALRGERPPTLLNETAWERRLRRLGGTGG